MDADRPADAAVSPGRPGPRSRLFTAPPRWLTMGLAVLLVALVVTGAVLGWQLREAQAGQDRRVEILQAASEHATDFLSVDYRRVGRDTGKVIEGAAGEFRRQYVRSRSRLESLVRQNRSISQGRVLSVGLVSADADSARAIVVADSTVRNLSTPEPQPRHYRLQLDLVRQDGRWLVSNLQFVG